MRDSGIVLASSSPRRSELLRSAGLTFRTATADAVEIHDPALGLSGLVLANARTKALAVASEYPESVVIGADTLVALLRELFPGIGRLPLSVITALLGGPVFIWMLRRDRVAG